MNMTRYTHMNNRIIHAVFFLGIILSACAKKDPIEKKKEKLKAYKTELVKLRSEIKELETEISSEDPAFARSNRKATLVTMRPVRKGRFEHYVEVTGTVESKRNITISAENTGVVLNIEATEGDEVQKGQLILRLDTDLLEKSLDRLETEYNLAKTMYEKQKNLWEKNIGTEVQYLESKNRKEALEDEIENIKTQIAKSKVRAPFEGTIDVIFVKEGEMAQAGMPLVRIVNHRGMYVSADLSEAFIGKFSKNDPVQIQFPAYNNTVESVITSVGQVIDQQNRTFRIEAKLPTVDFTIKPNLLVVMKLKDFEKKEAAVVPTNLIQKDSKGDFVYIITHASNDTISKKIHIERGMTYNYETMVDAGLDGDELLVDEGFRDVIDGTKVKVVDKVL
jgi:RND family efflux transporter MFP subunit